MWERFLPHFLSGNGKGESSSCAGTVQGGWSRGGRMGGMFGQRDLSTIWGPSIRSCLPCMATQKDQKGQRTKRHPSRWGLAGGGEMQKTWSRPPEALAE